MSFLFDEVNSSSKVLDSYLELKALYNWDMIDCLRGGRVKSIEEIHQEIMYIVKEKIKETA